MANKQGERAAADFKHHTTPFYLSGFFFLVMEAFLSGAPPEGVKPAQKRPTVIRVARKRGQPVAEYLVVTAQPSMKRRMVDGLASLSTRDDRDAEDDDEDADGRGGGRPTNDSGTAVKRTRDEPVTDAPVGPGSGEASQAAAAAVPVAAAGAPGVPSLPPQYVFKLVDSVSSKAAASYAFSVNLSRKVRGLSRTANPAPDDSLAHRKPPVAGFGSREEQRKALRHTHRESVHSVRSARAAATRRPPVRGRGTADDSDVPGPDVGKHVSFAGVPRREPRHKGDTAAAREFFRLVDIVGGALEFDATHGGDSSGPAQHSKSVEQARTVVLNGVPAERRPTPATTKNTISLCPECTEVRGLEGEKRGGCGEGDEG